MTWLDKLERRFGRFAIPKLMFWLVMAQVLFYGLGLFTTFPIEALELRPAEIMKGQVWRFVTFILVPDIRYVSIFIIFAWLLLYIYGSALEGAWGEFRFNIFTLIGIVATGIAAMAGYFITGANFIVPNQFILMSFFLAFAALNPNYELLLFFVIPAKVKYLGWIAWAYFGYIVLFEAIPFKLIVIGAAVNMILFFGKDAFGSVKARQRRKTYEKQRQANEAEPFHTCAVCGLTDKDDPSMDFVYQDGKGYCRNHIPE